jgi:undecaprenyl pyrophosphate phosphatase UppP
MSVHLTYTEAIVTGLVQGVTELFPVSSLGHNVLLPALIGGNWAKTLNVSAKNSPYLAFVVGLHVATAVAMIAYFWRDWLRIVRGFFSSLRTRSISTANERLAWMIILATIPVGIVGALLQKVFVSVFAKPELTAVFLAINGLILLYSERQRRARAARAVRAPVRQPAAQAVAAAGPGWQGAQGTQGGQGWGPGGPGQGGRGGYSQQPGQQHRQGPEDWEYRQDPRGQDRGNAEDPWAGQDPWGEQSPRQGRHHRAGQDPRGHAEAQDPWAEQDAWGGQDPRTGQAPRGGRAPQGGQDSRAAQDPRGGYDPRGGQDPWGRQDPRGGQDPWGAQDPRSGQDPRGGQDPWGAQDPRSGQASWGGRDPRAAQAAWSAQDPRQAQAPWAEQGYPQQGHPRQGFQPQGGAPGAEGPRAVEIDRAVRADRRLSTMGYARAILVGSAQILALLPGISRDGIVTVTGMWRGLSTEDAVRFSFLLSAPVILAAGLLKGKDLFGPMGTGIHGPVLVGSLLAGIGAYLSVRFLTKYFSEDRSLNPFGIYCLVAGVASFAYLVLK